MAFVPALVVVDFQEDFLPPSGALAVHDGRSIAPVLNALLAMPFATAVASQDWHPHDHVSFAANHPPPHNVPFTSTVRIPNPSNPDEVTESQLWPVHCVQDSAGAALAPELDMARIREVVKKGTQQGVECYSVFGPPFRDPPLPDTGLADMLRAKGVTAVFVAGLAADYCVRWTAVDAAREGFDTYIVREGTRAVVPSAMDEVERALAEHGVRMVSIDGDEVGLVRQCTLPC
jgi:nicotinamidase-related amidase